MVSSHFPDLTEIEGLPSDRYPDTSNTLSPFKRSQDEASLEKRRRLKRLRFSNDVHAFPNSPELGQERKKTFSTATTAVNSKPGSPSESAPM